MAIVIDVVFATTSIAVALDRGASEVIPALDPASAREEGRRRAPGTVVLAGEQSNRPIDGFLEPWPCALARQSFVGKGVVYSSTNGTVALRQADVAGLLLSAALINAAAVASFAAEHHAGRDIVIVCAGSDKAFNLEDFYGAGYLVSLLAASGATFRYTDAARAARLLHDRASVQECLREARAGRIMTACGLDADIAFASQKSTLGIVPVSREGRILRA